MALEIYNGSTLLYSLPRVLGASLVDKLSGERTLSFSSLISRSQGMRPGLTAKLDGQYYNIVRVSRKITGGFPVTTAECEHISYLLNDEKYNLVTFVFEGTPMEGLHELLDDTPFSIGVCEATERVECYFTEGTLNRRNALMRFIDACGCEVEYDGYAINLRKHRGSTTRKVLMDGENVTDLSVTLDSRENTAAYEISLFKMADLQAGDEVNITYTPMGVNVDTRIVSITYNPFYRYTVRVEVGDYVPNLMASTVTQLDRIRQEFRAADGRMESTIETIEGDMSELLQTVSGFDLRIENAEGTVADLSLTVRGFDTRIESAEGAVADLSLTVGGYSTRIENVEGAVSTLSQTVSGFSTRIEDAEGNISTLSQTVSGFNTRIENTEGSISTINQSLTSITTRVSNAEGDISTVSQTANKVNWLIASGTSSTNFTMTDRAIKLVADTIDLSGYVTFSALSTSGKTTINGANITTGTISADRIDVSTLKVTTIFTTDHLRVAVQSSGTGNLYLGGDTTWNFEHTFIYGGTSVRIGAYGTWASHHLVFDTTDFAIHPSSIVDWDLGTISYPFGNLWCQLVNIRSTSSTVGRFGVNGGTFECLCCGANVNTLGSSTYYWDTGYITKLYLSSNCYLTASAGNLCVNGTAISGGGDGDFAGKEVKMGGSTTTTIVCNTSRELRPNSTSTYNAFYLGTASYYWHYAYIGSVSAKIGSTKSSKIGFFAATPIAQLALSSSSQNMSYSYATSSNYLKILNNIAGILIKYGLITG